MSERPRSSLIIRATTVTAMAFSLCAALSALSILGSILGYTGPVFQPGAFLFNSYGSLSFAVPVYLFLSALLLADGKYRPRLIFVLSASVLPFLTLAAGLSLSGKLSFLAGLSQRSRISVLSSILILEALVLVAATLTLFPARRERPGRREDDRANKKSPEPVQTATTKSGGITLKFLPAPKGERGSVARAPHSADGSASGVAIANPSFDFPPLKALSSLETERELSGGIPIGEADVAGVYFDRKGALTPEPLSPEEDPLASIEDFIPGDEADAVVVTDESEAFPLDNSSEEVDLTPLFSRAPEEVSELEDVPGLDSGSEPELESGSDFDLDEETEVELDLEPEAGIAPDEDHSLAFMPETGSLVEEDILEREPPIEEPVVQAALPHAVHVIPVTPAGAGIAAAMAAGGSDLAKALSEAEADAEAKTRAAAAAAALKADVAVSASIPRKKRGGPYAVPVDGILTAYPDGEYWVIDQATRDAAVILKETLEEFNIAAEVTGIKRGPVITMFEILPAPGVKLSKIVNLQDNIALRLAASSVRIVAPIPGKHAVGIEVPNRKRNIVSFREMIESEMARDGKKGEIPVILGKDITGDAQTLDLVQTPHLMIAGSTGSGKSVCVNSIILSILYQRSPAECRLILIDPKIVELKLYNDVPHLLTPVITESKRAFQALQYCIYEMERRYALLDSMGVRDIRSYNKRIKERNIATEHLPYIVVIIDEFADLMATTGKELESTVARLAAMSRAVGIHLVLATQRPSIDVITGLIKANIPSRIAFMVASKMDSRIIIDMVGAEKLLGKGDLLFASAWDPFPIRMQGAFVSEEEVERVVEYVKTLGEPDYIDEEIFYDEEDEVAEPTLFNDGDDPMYDKALEIVMQQGKASASYIQRRLKIGYNRAARLVESMEDRGIVGPAQGSKPRDLLRGM